MYFGSADLMERNLDRRVEVVAPVLDPELRHHLRHVVLEALLADTHRAWELRTDGSYARMAPQPGASALNAQQDIQNSHDLSVERFTWWDHRGTEEWVQFDFESPARVRGVEVYWFDDTGRGGCRVPESWRLLYRDGEQWKPVQTQDGFGVAKDRYNGVSFAPVTTSGLRIELQLQPKFSGGVLEWKVR